MDFIFDANDLALVAFCGVFKVVFEPVLELVQLSCEENIV